VSRDDDVTSPSAPRRYRVISTGEGTHPSAFAALDWALFASVGCIWGASFLFIAIGLEAFEPSLITWGRILSGAAVLSLVPAARVRIDRDDRPRLVALSVLWVALPFTLFPLAEEHITSGLVGLLNGSIPIITAAIGSMMLRRLPDRSRLLGLLIGFAGVATMALPAAGSGSSEAVGVALVLGAVTCYGLAINTSTSLTQRYGSLAVMKKMLALAAVWTAPFGVWGLARSSFGWGSLVAVAVLGAVGTGIAFVLMGRLVSRVGPTRGAFANYLIPIVAMILGAIFLDERIRGTSIVGIVLVVGGAVLASRRGLPAPRDSRSASTSTTPPSE
jgi:drug/metabolite transporter (DMT)-like permease